MPPPPPPPCSSCARSSGCCWHSHQPPSSLSRGLGPSVHPAKKRIPSADSGRMAEAVAVCVLLSQPQSLCGRHLGFTSHWMYGVSQPKAARAGREHLKGPQPSGSLKRGSVERCASHLVPSDQVKITEQSPIRKQKCSPAKDYDVRPYFIFFRCSQDHFLKDILE